MDKDKLKIDIDDYLEDEEDDFAANIDTSDDVTIVYSILFFISVY